MFLITRRKQFGPTTFLWDVHAPDVARAARPGHFVMARIDEHGERIPLTVADFNARQGTVTVVIQAVGKTTFEMLALREGDAILDFIGPLGLPSHIRNLEGTVVLVGGGLGVAPIYPQLREYKNRGNRTDLDRWIPQQRPGLLGRPVPRPERRADRHHRRRQLRPQGLRHPCSGRCPRPRKEHPRSGRHRPHPDDEGLLRESTRPFGIPTIVSLNSIMVDGTGMCGSCRVTVGGKMKFACVDGADFDGHLVNFDELALRQKRFEREEKAALDRFRNESAKLASLQAQPNPTAGRSSTCELPEPDSDAARSARSQEHQDHSAGARPHATPAARGARPQLQRSRARTRSRRRSARGRALPALQEAALRARLPRGHRHPRLHRRAAASRHQAARTRS